MLAHARPMARQEARAIFSRAEFRDFRNLDEFFYPKLSPLPRPLRPSTEDATSSALQFSSPNPRISLSFLGEEGRLSVRGSREIARYCRYSRMKTDGARFHGVCRHGWEETDTGETVLKVVRKKKWNERRSPDDRAMT